MLAFHPVADVATVGGVTLRTTPVAHPVEAYRQAWVLLEASAPLKALEILQPAIESEPESASLRTLRAWAYFQSAQLQRAESELASLVDQCPTDVWARFALGRVLERQSRYRSGGAGSWD